ncbi:KGGVGR-motif variant AAA ATPase [Paraburkholderia sediminicola]|uniref:KGGVGR-motif variant AAA ATPase n=1 Tax=Paraburkholderia sediminicola TaxID=458836 RepID=UPI0038B9D652
MTAIENSNGKIVTFYSFKGGVGRTMALANIAFLAALNGKRVLVMDWDLEAPGLAYYFKCLHDASQARNLREAPGVLDLLWDWVVSTRNASNNADFEMLFERFKSGQVFDRCVHSLIPREFVSNGGILDFIGAGAKTVASCDLPYEDALAQFSWPQFFEEGIGGIMLQELSQWARTNYDFVFLDSRTGLADVAGICTMQLPDTVALCFVLNRQNIDGVARVANAIRTKRADKVALRAVPMRVASRDSSEASDAQARALSELSRTGGFSRDAARDDLRSLAILTSDTVPYYETLVPFLTDNPLTDPLTQNYAQTASHILNTQINAVPLDASWVELARSHLQPKLATLEYITKLRTAEPTRVVEELSRLVQTALEVALDGYDLDNEYVRELVDSVELVEAINIPQTSELYAVVFDLLHALAARDPSRWHELLTSTLDRYLETFGFMLDDEEAITLLEELDTLLLAYPTIEGTIRRVKNKRELASKYLDSANTESGQQAADEILIISKTIREEHPLLAPDQLDALDCAELDGHLLMARGYEGLKEEDDARTHYFQGLDLLRDLRISNVSQEFRRLGSLLFARLALLEDFGDEQSHFRAECAINSMQWATYVGWRAGRFASLGSVILNQPERQYVLEFCRAALPQGDSREVSLFANHVSRGSRAGTAFLNVVRDMAIILSSHASDEDLVVLSNLASVANMVIGGLRRRPQSHDTSSLENIVHDLRQIFSPLDIEIALDPVGTKLSDRARRNPGTGD